MKVLVYGAGAVGLGLASCLIKARADVTLVARLNTVEALRRSGLVRSGIFGRLNAPPKTFSACQSLAEVQPGDFDYILVCVKSFDSDAAAADLAGHRERFGEQARIVLCQNGWGNAEVFAQYFEKVRIYNARVITGFTRRQPNEVEITVHADAIHIGSLFTHDVECIRQLCEAITAGGIPCQPATSIEKDLWAKMLYNCALNPLGAILDVPYGKLAENRFTRDIMNSIVEEIFAVINAAGYRTHWDAAEGFLEVFYGRLIPDTAGHRSSTLQSIIAGKRTEIDALTGEVLKLSDTHRVPVPCNRTIYSIIKALEAALA